MKKLLSLCAAVALVLTGAIVGCEPAGNNPAEEAIENAENDLNAMENEL